MKDPLEPKNKRERKHRNYFSAGTTGKIPWKAREIEECFRHLDKEFAELSEKDRKDWCPYVASLVFIKNKYGDNKGSLYFLRMGAIISFLTHYRKRLERDKLISVRADGMEFWEDHLVDAFARLAYTMESFRYEDVKAYVEHCKKPS